MGKERKQIRDVGLVVESKWECTDDAWNRLQKQHHPIARMKKGIGQGAIGFHSQDSRQNAMALIDAKKPWYRSWARRSASQP